MNVAYAILRLKLCLIFVCSVITSFFFGLYYWRVFIQFPCASTNVPTITIKYSFYEHFQHRTVRTCQYDQAKLFLTIAIISSAERLLVYLPSILETWASSTTNDIEIILFIEENSTQIEYAIENIFFQFNNNNLKQSMKACLYVVKLKNVENAYPPQKKSFFTMKFIYAFYRQRTSWVLRLDDNAFVNIDELIKWLKSIDHRQPLYIGQGGVGRRNGSAIHFPPGKLFCMGGSGVILSQNTLIKLGPWLDYCLANEIRTHHEDVELGRCILNHVHISCSKSYDSKSLFYHHYGPEYHFGYDFTTTIISKALIMHPITDFYTFQQIFAFYLRQKQEKQYHHQNISRKTAKTKSSYVTFSAEVEFDLSHDSTYERIDVRWKSYIERTIRSYIETTKLILHKHSIHWTWMGNKFMFGYHRVVLSHGIQITIEILLRAQVIPRSLKQFITTQTRFQINHMFAHKHHFDYREITNIDSNETMYQLNLIVVSSNKDEALIHFIDNFQSEVLNYPHRDKHFTLTIVYFLQKNQTNNQTIDFISQLSVRYKSTLRLSVINENQTTYNRGLGRQLASNLFSSNQLLFFLDVDIQFTGYALDNTRRLMIHLLSVSSCAVYFPIIFSLHSKMFTINKTNTINVNVKNGLFSIHGFGNVALRKQDLDRVGGWETTNYDWGIEDVDLFQRFNDISSECQTFRAVEPGLTHNFHKKMCNGISNKFREQMCREADTMLIGSHQDMSNYYLTWNN